MNFDQFFMSMILHRISVYSILNITKYDYFKYSVFRLCYNCSTFILYIIKGYFYGMGQKLLDY